MATAQNWVQRLSGDIGHLTPALLERALWSHSLRGAVFHQLERQIIAEIENSVGSRCPAQVGQDKVDMARALLGCLHRALERQQLSRRCLHGLVRTMLVNNVSTLQNETLKEVRRRFAERHEGHAPPLLMVISPTSACNLRCPDCYASSGGAGAQLEWDVLDRIITEAKTLWGMRFFTISGGEPLAYRSQGKDLLDMASKHRDCFFLMYTNGTLINEQVVGRMLDMANLSPAISVEGMEARTDGRRGAGVFRKVLAAMALLRQAGVPFGVSLTATRLNAEELLSDAFIDFFFDEQQAIYGWIFQYMPIGRGYTLNLLPTPEQRLWMWRRTWQLIRERRILLADFWNCGTASQGCIAAAQEEGYLYIDWNGKVMPCVFVPYSPANIHELYAQGRTLEDLYDLPYFRAIRQWQCVYALGKERPEEYGNWLLPCSLRDHYTVGRRLIDEFHPQPQNEEAATALHDPAYYEGLVAYDQKLQKVFDPVWEQMYLKFPAA